MSKNIIFITVGIILALLVAGLLYFSQRSITSEEAGSDVAGELNIKTASNPTEAVPEVNPVKKTNPFGSTYKNPFE
ncbi:MAG: hypothetical protein HYT03_00215 [Candidatus Harrisonbacteria bacterium]|nr:hypothetical protein [Candidatus Harrisonbacteria bacterium]